ncbi:hypothetical protein DICPUDRAFT_47001 [Dictyostelium purpureum]|uniref:Glucokinase n=1 Tax=Dictyostelium purpureum TaxID=5786 RepID=F0ZH76_DICPU|nr:uncharacterized protein DICPUDRAFT_47001 [Dictyostelium purpureum]EGC36671.1 hypothetical protein DICPUDRAFT_47001 [Dictyostelium purpureum]|eukprot:XP_003286770.1 hypothetical protein DICPUDRAFT_47001 [Dictyostelium purpureum]
MVYNVLGDYSKLAVEVKKDNQYYIGIDIGGTNTRVVYATAKGDYYTIKEFLCSSVKVLLEELFIIQDTLLTEFVEPTFTTIDLAGPHLSKNKYKFTNYVESDNILLTEYLPKKLCPEGRYAILNDLESGSYGIIPYIISGKSEEIFLNLITPEEAKEIPTNGVFVVLAAGTGLGVGLIHKYGEEYRVIPSEFGHISICSDDGDCEQELFAKLSENIKNTEPSRKNYCLEYEDIVSGRGIQALYMINKNQNEPARDNAEIATQATNAPANLDCTCVKTMKIHYKYLLRCAREISVGTFATGVYLIGDNIVRNKNFVDSVKNQLEFEFKDHPKIEWLRHIPVFGQSALKNLNLIGTVYYGINAAKKLPSL